MIIKTGPVNMLSTDELIIAEAYLGVIADKVHENGQETPDALKEDLRAVSAALVERQRGDKERQLKALKLRAEGLKSIDQKRVETNKEIERLEVELGLREPAKAGKSRARQ